MERRHHLFSQLRIRYSGFQITPEKMKPNDMYKYRNVDKTYILLADVEM